MTPPTWPGAAADSRQIDAMAPAMAVAPQPATGPGYGAAPPGLRWRSADGARHHGSRRPHLRLRIRTTGPSSPLPEFLSGSSTRCSPATVPAPRLRRCSRQRIVEQQPAMPPPVTGRVPPGYMQGQKPDHGSGVRRAPMYAPTIQPEKTVSSTAIVSADRSASDRGRCGRLSTSSGSSSTSVVTFRTSLMTAFGPRGAQESWSVDVAFPTPNRTLLAIISDLKSR